MFKIQIFTPRRMMFAVQTIHHRAGWCSGNPLDSYSRGAPFEFQPEHQLSWVKFFVVFLSEPRQTFGCNPDLIHVRFLSNSPLSLIPWHLCSKQELWSQHGQPLLRNGSANTPVTRQQLCKHASIPKPSLSNVPMQQQSNFWKRYFLCGPCWGYITRTSCH
jgi:hypothetical protein